MSDLLLLHGKKPCVCITMYRTAQQHTQFSLFQMYINCSHASKLHATFKRGVTLPFPEPSSSKKSLKTRKKTILVVSLHACNRAVSLPSEQGKCVCIQVLKVYFLAEDWKYQCFITSPLGKENNPCQGRKKLDCSSRLFAQPASTAFLFLLPLRDKVIYSVPSKSHLMLFFFTGGGFV